MELISQICMKQYKDVPDMMLYAKIRLYQDYARKVIIS